MLEGPPSPGSGVCSLAGPSREHSCPGTGRHRDGKDGAPLGEARLSALSFPGRGSPEAWRLSRAPRSYSRLGSLIPKPQRPGCENRLPALWLFLSIQKVPCRPTQLAARGRRQDGAASTGPVLPGRRVHPSALVSGSTCLLSGRAASWSTGLEREDPGSPQTCRCRPAPPQPCGLLWAAGRPSHVPRELRVKSDLRPGLQVGEDFSRRHVSSPPLHLPLPGLAQNCSGPRPGLGSGPGVGGPGGWVVCVHTWALRTLAHTHPPTYSFTPRNRRSRARLPWGPRKGTTAPALVTLLV